MASRYIILSVLTVAVALSASAVTVSGQEPQAPTQPPVAQQEVEVTEELLERFVEVYPQVLEASQEAQAQLAQATDTAEAQAIQAEAEQTIMAVLEEEEMSPAEYQAVVVALRDDEQLRQEFMRMLQEAQVEPGA